MSIPSYPCIFLSTSECIFQINQCNVHWYQNWRALASTAVIRCTVAVLQRYPLLYPSPGPVLSSRLTKFSNGPITAIKWEAPHVLTQSLNSSLRRTVAYTITTVTIQPSSSPWVPASELKTSSVWSDTISWTERWAWWRLLHSSGTDSF